MFILAFGLLLAFGLQGQFSEISPESIGDLPSQDDPCTLCKGGSLYCGGYSGGPCGVVYMPKKAVKELK